MIKLEIINHEQAVRLKKLGYPQDERMCYNDKGKMIFNLSHHDKYPSIAYYEQVLKWFRDEKNIIVSILPRGDKFFFIFFKKGKFGSTQIDGTNELNPSNTYEEAMSNGIDKVLEVLEHNFVGNIFS